jgi:23S rRNA pseudouridine2605 synthase
MTEHKSNSSGYNPADEQDHFSLSGDELAIIAAHAGADEQAASQDKRRPDVRGEPKPRRIKPALSANPWTSNDPPQDLNGERIAKAMARAGLCSRRDAERWIADGRVAINGKLLDSPAFNVKPGDKITVDGNPIETPEATRLWRYHKPSGLVTSHKDPQGRQTVFEHLPEDLPRVISVGRLDLTSEGLLLLTNDGALARTLELPATGWLRKYRVRAFGRVTQADLTKLKDGIEVDGVRYGPIEAILERAETANAWLSVALREGKNREVRRVLEAIGLKVNRLIRVSYGPFQLGKMAVGSVEEVKPEALAEMLGPLMPAPPPRFDAKPRRASPKAVLSGSAAPRPDRSRADQSRPDQNKLDKRGPKPVPKSAKTRVSLLDEEDMRKGKRKGAPASGLSARKIQHVGKAKQVGKANRAEVQARAARADAGPKRTQHSTKPTKPRA